MAMTCPSRLTDQRRSQRRRARIDGSSPVEYLTTDDDRAAVRDFATAFLIRPPSSTAAVLDLWAASRTSSASHRPDPTGPVPAPSPRGRT